ncbi:MAG: PhoPQ-activated pathogenicity-related family protein [Planctomycetes bacterium]|nr:PhoPQ-activated pathogenicity-related family protein [Planctomycetota bacterium]
MSKQRPIAILLTWCLTACAFVDGDPLPAGETALDRYVAKPDPTYSWKVVRTVSDNGLTHYIVDLKSQTWRTDQEIDRPVWQHWLSIIKPANSVSKTALLRIGGGENDGAPPESADPVTVRLAEATNSVVADLRMVPNQPLVLHRDGVPRKEDDFVAYTWDQFLKTGDETWPARLPMVKSAVRAMDCVQELLASDQGGRVTIERFVVSGGSKRGWTTWCTAAVDQRVAAAIPIVIDVINVPACSRHHVAAYGFYAAAIGDYVRHNLTGRSQHPRTKLLYEIEDPYSYRDRLTMPKFVVNAAGDQYFPPDSSQFYFGDLQGEKHLRYVPNADHSLRDSDALESIIAYYQMILAGSPRPRFNWSFESDGSIQVHATTAPKAVTLWQATNPRARDFRVMTIGKAYRSRTLSADGGGGFVGRIDPPSSGWTAFFVELTFDVGQAFPLKLTTAVRILPDRLPFADLDPANAPLEPRAGK